MEFGYFLLGIVLATVCGAITEQIAKSKENKSFGFGLGFFLGIIGIIIMICRKDDLPKQEKLVKALKENDYLLETNVITKYAHGEKRKELIATYK